MSTPPPGPARAQTPPTPLHGAKHDAFEPFSPRRSSRIHTKQNVSAAAAQTAIAPSLPPSKRKSTFRRTSSQTFSPPSSPISPPRRAPSDQDSHPHQETGRKRAKLSPPDEFDFADASGLDLPKASRPAAPLPTPAKTPRKRAVAAGPEFRATARVLFPGNAMHPDDEVPTPRKTRKAQRANAVTLESFAQAPQDDVSGIEIYTDSKDRVPELDETEDNPFLERPSGSRHSRAERVQPSRKSKSGLGKEVDDAVDNNEGMVYVFRGKKIFRRFTSPERAAAREEFGDGEVRRAAGVAARGEFSRREVKPRLLFPPQDNAEVTDEEEATTDIETAADAPVQQTPKKSVRMVTPPTTVRTTRHADVFANDDASSADGPSRKGKSLFDLWQRTKPGADAGAPAKRERDDMAGATRSSKRSCSGGGGGGN